MRDGDLAKSRQLPLKPPEVDRCPSRDHEHENIQCYKQAGHLLNWHEAPDTGGAIIHTWIDPAMRKVVTPPLLADVL